MPQLDPAVFSPQLVWLAITFALLYLLMAKVALPRISGVLEERRKRREDNLARAEQLQHDAEAAARAYEEAIAGARSSAHSMLAETTEQSKARAEARLSELDAALKRKTAEAEAAIDEARAGALREASGIAAEAARLAAEKLAGVRVAEGEARDAADAARKARA